MTSKILKESGVRGGSASKYDYIDILEGLIALGIAGSGLQNRG